MGWQKKKKNKSSKRNKLDWGMQRKKTKHGSDANAQPTQSRNTRNRLTYKKSFAPAQEQLLYQRQNKKQR